MSELALQSEELMDAIVADSIDESGLEELDAFIADQEKKSSEVIDSEALKDVEAEIELAETKAEIYADGEPELDKIDTPEPVKAKKTGGRAKPGAKPSEALQARLGSNVYSTVLVSEDDATLGEAELKDRIDGYLDGFDGLAKKVGEKVVNFYVSLAGTAQMSNYTRIALDLLREKDQITVTDIRNKYMDAPYTIGTSSSQASQMNLLLPAIGIATKVGNALKLNESSPIFELVFDAKA